MHPQGEKVRVALWPALCYTSIVIRKDFDYESESFKNIRILQDYRETDRLRSL